MRRVFADTVFGQATAPNRRLISAVRVKGSAFEAEELLDVLCQGIIDLVVPRDRLPQPGNRVQVDVVTLTMPVKCATRLLKRTNQIAALHKAMSLIW
jgi:hypothetical protein